MLNLNLRKQRPYTPGQRWQIKPVQTMPTNKTIKSLSLAFPWRAGRNISGKIIFKHHKKLKSKKRNHKFATMLNFNDIVITKALLLCNKKKKTAIYCITKRGGHFMLPHVISNHPGKVYYPNNSTKTLNLHFFIGLPIALEIIPVYSPLCCLASAPFSRFQYILASGTFGVRLRAPKNEKLLKVRMPSKTIKFFKKKSTAIVGKNKQLWNSKWVVGKAGINRNLGYSPQVRGIAMNSVDHPHGGKANSVQPEKSPWGWVTKCNK